MTAPAAPRDAGAATPARPPGEIDRGGAAASQLPAHRDRLELEAMMLLARANPRNEIEASTDLLALCRDAEFAQDAIDYDKRSGDLYFTVEFAREARRVWRNLRSGIRVTEAGESFVIEGWAVDVERCISESVQTVQPRKILRKERGEARATWRETDDVDALRAAVLSTGARLERNAVLRLLPRSVLAMALGVLRETREGGAAAAGGGRSPTSQLRKILETFAPHGVRWADLEQLLGHNPAHVTAGELAALRHAVQLLQGGAAWPDVLERRSELGVIAAAPTAAPGVGRGEPGEREDQSLEPVDPETSGPTVETPGPRIWQTRLEPDRAEPGDRWERDGEPSRILGADGRWRAEGEPARVAEPEPAEPADGMIWRAPTEDLVRISGAWRGVGLIVKAYEKTKPGSRTIATEWFGKPLEELDVNQLAEIAAELARIKLRYDQQNRGQRK